MSTRPVVMFAMGKTGTTTLEEMIRASTRRPVVKAHALTRAGVRSRLRSHAMLGTSERPTYLWKSEALRVALALPGRRWQLVSSVRDPVAMAVSAHFYGRAHRMAAGIEAGRPDDIEFHVAGVTRILEVRVLAEDWFDQELRNTTGIDVYGHPFDPTAGWAHYTHGRFQVALVRMEDLGKVAHTALSELLGEPVHAEAPRLNRGGRTDDAYANFLRARPLPPDLVTAAYGTRLARHFYSPAERAAMHRAWLAPSP